MVKPLLLHYITCGVAFSAGAHAKVDNNIFPTATTGPSLPYDVFEDARATAPPAVPKALQKRQDMSAASSAETTSSILISPDNVCGYIEGRAGVPYSCPEDSVCMMRPADDLYYGNVRCCNDDACAFNLGCFDLEQVSGSECGSGCLLDNQILKCTNTAQPYCNTVSFTSDILDYYCNSFFDNSTQAASTTFDGQTGRTWATELLISATTTTTSEEDDDDSSTASTTTSSSTRTGEDGAGTTSGGSTDGGNDDDGGSSPPIGAIVGGVVGGVVVIAGIAAGFWFMRRQKRKHAEGSTAATASGGFPPQEVQQTPSAGGPGGYPPGPGGYAPSPHQSYYDPAAVQHQQQQPYAHMSPPPGYLPTPPLQQLAPGGHYPSTAGTPERHDVASPPGALDYQKGAAAVQQPAGPVFGSGPGGYAAVPQNPQQQPQVHEAPGQNDGHHRGQLHEMA